MIKFNDTSLVTLYIKQLLKDFNLPNCAVFEPGRRVYKDCFYIYKNTILKAKQTCEPLTTGSEYFEVVNDNYTFGDSVLNITKNMVVNNLIYDSYTHEYLGDYLRFLKSYKNIDLMSLYNCFSNRTISDIIIYDAIESKDSSGKITLKDYSNKDGSKVYVIDINPFNVYTIFIDSVEPVEMIACFYDGNDIMNLRFGETKAISFPYAATYMKQSDLSFNKPFVYDKLSKENLSTSIWDSIKDPLAYNHIKDLKLLVKVSAANNSSLVVLEGDYTNNMKLHFNDNKSLALTDMIKSKPYDNSGRAVEGLKFDQNREENYLSRIGLASLQTNSHHPFSDRLIEYLFGSVITPDDEIENNIARLQKLLYNGVYVGKLTPNSESEIVRLNRIGFNGVWSNAIRNCNYNIAKKFNLTNTKYDILGYLDKDLELAIGLEDDE